MEDKHVKQTNILTASIQNELMYYTKDHSVESEFIFTLIKVSCTCSCSHCREQSYQLKSGNEAGLLVTDLVLP